ncbi:MAG: 4Fe-4S ferredoxin [Actinomycetota bacterium]
MSRSRKQIEILSRPWSFWLFERMAPLARFKLTKALIPGFRDEGLNISVLPINEGIVAPGDTPLPIQLLEGFITDASHRVLVDHCPCRHAMDCRRYPHEIGCLMMGEAALEISPSVGREISVEEALEHAHKAVDAGLVPMVGKARVDNIVFGIRDKKRLLSCCFCCECCCISRFARHMPADKRANNVVRLAGLRLEVSDECDGCGACVKRCFLQELKVIDDRAVIPLGCAGCGRCATVCKRGAISLHLDDPAFIMEARERIGALAKYQ